MQTISQKSVVVKYKAELASQNYVAAVGNANAFKKKELLEDYLPVLERLEDNEKSRIQFVTERLDKLIGMFHSVSHALGQTAGLMKAQNDTVTGEQTLAHFIQTQGQDCGDVTQQIQIEVYKPPSHLLKSKQEMVAK